MDRAKGLGEEKVSRLLWRFSVPAITGMMVNALYNVIDSIFVGHAVGEIGLAAVTIAFPIMMLLMGFSMLIGVGASTLISIRLGEQKRAEAEKILGNALMMNIILTLLCILGLSLWLEPILVMLGATPEVLPYAFSFTRVILVGCVFLFVGMSLNNAIRAEGNPPMAMLTMIIGAVLNTILNPLFLFVFHMGIAGSALATVISSAVTALWTLWYFVFGKSVLRLHWTNLVLKLRIVNSMVKNGIPPFLMQIVASSIIIILNYNFLRFGGDLAVAAGGIINRVSMLLFMPVIGISQGVQPIIGDK
ncbi:MAG: MATE family efflux transporter, partial [Pelosinus sp.]|nr:MATE family efflux transporter [Pelosinus sp.]